MYNKAGASTLLVLIVSIAELEICAGNYTKPIEEIYSIVTQAQRATQQRYSSCTSHSSIHSTVCSYLYCIFLQSTAQHRMCSGYHRIRAEKDFVPTHRHPCYNATIKTDLCENTRTCILHLCSRLKPPLIDKAEYGRSGWPIAVVPARYENEAEANKTMLRTRLLPIHSRQPKYEGSPQR